MFRLNPPSYFTSATPYHSVKLRGRAIFRQPFKDKDQETQYQRYQKRLQDLLYALRQKQRSSTATDILNALAYQYSRLEKSDYTQDLIQNFRNWLEAGIYVNDTYDKGNTVKIAEYFVQKLAPKAAYDSPEQQQKLVEIKTNLDAWLPHEGATLPNGEDPLPPAKTMKEILCYFTPKNNPSSILTNGTTEVIKTQASRADKIKIEKKEPTLADYKEQLSKLDLKNQKKWNSLLEIYFNGLRIADACEQKEKKIKETNTVRAKSIKSKYETFKQQKEDKDALADHLFNLVTVVPKVATPLQNLFNGTYKSVSKSTK